MGGVPHLDTRLRRAFVPVALAAIAVGPFHADPVGARPTREVEAAAPANPWAEARRPSSGPARSLGGYSAGCLRGGARLPERGKGFRVAEPERGRFFGHPALIDFIRDLGRGVHRRGLGVLPIGDLSQPRGGPAPSGHSSHQTGLDADIWYADGRGSRRPKKVAMVDLDSNRPTDAYGRRVERVLALAARDPRVDRIFVNPVVKAELCRAGKRPGWLRKVRPWWLHHEHFHVRLACPDDSPECEAQKPIADGDGCEDVKWWLAPKADDERSEKRKRYRSRIGTLPALPDGCAELVEHAGR
jgi:penicillin-insensitive murein DD-endopeptidase